MDRREFLGYCAAAGWSAAGCDPAKGLSPGSASPEDGKQSAGLMIADAHSHPYQVHGARQYDPSTPTIGMMQQLGMAVCSFSAVGDMTYYRGQSGTPYSDTQFQLTQVMRLVEKGQVRLISKSSDLKSLLASRSVTGALMAIEGGDALEGRLQNLDAFHDYGVRLMTVMHDRDNEIGFNQRSSADGPLTPFGIQLIEKMNKLGMVIDVSHCKTRTLHSIAEVSAAPLVDSHTSLVLPGEALAGSRRLRPWQEMETIAKTGGIVCTWPFAYSGTHSHRTTPGDWAGEIVQMKSRLGIEHCGLGTDGGGGLPRLIKGWKSIASLPDLIGATREAGLTQEDIAAYVGGNFLRLLELCLA